MTPKRSVLTGERSVNSGCLCSWSDAPLIYNLARVTEDSFARDRLRAPVAVWLIAGFAALFITLTCLLLLLAKLHVDAFSIGGRHVAPEEWLRVAAPLFVILSLGFCAILYGIATRRRFSVNECSVTIARF